MRSDLQRSLTSEGVTITAEIMPPRGANAFNAVSKAKRLAGLVHALNVTDGSRAVMRMSSMAVCKLLLEEGLEPVFQVACRDRNRIGLQGDLLGADALGIKNILCLTGDPVKVGDQPDAKQVSDYGSISLLQQISKFNNGCDPVKGSLPDGPTKLFAGAAADPNCHSLKGLRYRMEQKKQAGAEFIQTQMVMNPYVLENFCREVADPLAIPVLAGVFLLKSAKNAQFINNVVPGACIPDKIISRLDNAKDSKAEGILIAAEQVKQYSGLAKGIHLMAIKAEDTIPEILSKASISSINS